MGIPSIYPTGTTIFNPDKCWNGYTLYQAVEKGAILIDMNGNQVQIWEGVHGFPNKMLPGGFLLGHTGERPHHFGFHDKVDIVQIDWDGNIVWKFDKYEFIEDPGEKPRWMALQHHDYQLEGNPVGYYVPGMDPVVENGKMIILSHKYLTQPAISHKTLIDDTFIEISKDGDVTWEWVCSDHFDEMNFSEAAKNIMARNPAIKPFEGTPYGDWMHINSMSWLGPNKWFDNGDTRFHPENIIWCGRQTNIIGITDRQTGKIVWQIGPDYDATPEMRKLGWIIGQHHAHMIPSGLPGEGNILVFDNGGNAGFGAPNPNSPTGYNNLVRDYSRVLEFDPTTLEIVWQYTPEEAGFRMPFDSASFYSFFLSSVQRLPNGNTLITQGAKGHIIEVTQDHELVWEHISPYWGKSWGMNILYRAYRVPYGWIPQLDLPKEIRIDKIDITKFRMPGAGSFEPLRTVRVEGTVPGCFPCP